MSWIKVIEEDEAAAPLREAYAAVRGARGEVANIVNRIARGLGVELEA